MAQVLAVTCERFAALSFFRRRTLWAQVRRALEIEGHVMSGTGMSASCAINECEERGWPYKVTAQDGRYFVERTDNMGGVRGELEG